jgi:hypothetical protein
MGVHLGGEVGDTCGPVNFCARAKLPVRRMTRLKANIVAVVFFIVLLLDKIPQF